MPGLDRPYDAFSDSTLFSFRTVRRRIVKYEIGVAFRLLKNLLSAVCFPLCDL